MKPLSQQLLAEGLGSAILLSAIVGSGIMGERLSGGIEGLALLANSIATGSILFVLITMLQPHSGAHLNPAVTAVMVARGELTLAAGVAYVANQLVGACVGVVATHAMFDQPLIQFSDNVRSGFPQHFSEAVATFGLVVVVILTRHARPHAVAQSVAVYVIAAYCLYFVC